MPTEPLESAAPALEARLTAALGDEWIVRDVNGKSTPRATRYTLYHEQGDLVTSHNGTAFPAAFIGAQFMLTVESGLAEPTEAIADVTRGVVALIRAIDPMRDVYWDAATREVLTSGHAVYRVPVTFITTIRTAPADTTPEENTHG